MSFPVSITFSVQTPPIAAFDALGQSASKLDQSLASSAGNLDKFGSSVSQLESPLSGVSGSMGELEGSMSGLEGSLGSAAGSMGEFASSTGELNGAIGETGGVVTEASGSMSELSGATSETGGAMTELSGSTTETGGAMTELSGTTTETGGAMTELQTSATDTGTSMTDLGTATGETNTVLTDTNTVLSETAPVMTDTATGTTDLAQGFTDLAPPVEESNAMLTETVPILEGAGTAAEDASGSTETYGGALSSLNAEIEPVNGGLTETSTLAGDVSMATDEASTSAGGLGTAFGSLGGSVTALTGGVLSLYSSFTNVRDAQAAVDKANIKVIDTNTKLDTSINTLNRSLNKIVADTQNQISGQERLAAAQAKFNALIDAGVRSGPEFSAALQELRAAQDALSSSTVKGNEMIAKAGPLIDKVETSSRKATNATLGQTRATEDLAGAMLGIVGGVTTAIGSIAGITQTLSSGGVALGTFKAGITGITIALSGSLIPALGAVAVPAAIAVGAIAAFVGAMEAIRANIGIFDELGVSIGNVFPTLRGFLDDGRQAFINFTDGINTGISMLLGGFDSLTGGVLNAQKQWDGFTGALPKGTGELGLAGKAAGLLGLAFADASERIKVGAGKWKEADGNLVRLNGSILATAGNWDVLSDGTAVYLKTAEKVPPVTEQTAESTTKMSEATKKAADELAKVGTAVEEANAKIAFYSEASKMAELTSASFALGVANAKVELIDKTAKLAEGAGALQTYSQQLADGSLQELAYKEGVLQAGMALVEKVTALEKAKGAYDATNKLIQEGTLLAAEFATGMQDTKTAIQDTALELVNLAGQQAAYNDEATATKAIANELVQGFLDQKQALIDLALEAAHATGEIAALRQELENSEAGAIRFAAGLIEGRRSALEFLTGIQQAKGEAQGFHDEMVRAAEGVSGAMADMSSQSSEQLKRFMEVVQGVPSAFEEVANGLGKFTQKVVQQLGKAGKEGADAFMENIAKMEEELGAQFSEPLVRDLQLAVQVDKAKQDVETALGVLGAALAAQPLTAEFDNSRVLEAIRVIEQSYAGLPASSQAAFAPLQASLDRLKAWQPGTGITGLAPIMAHILSSAESLGGPLQGLISAFGNMSGIANASATELQAVQAAFQAVGLTLDTATGQIKNAAGQIVGSFGTLGPAATAAGTDTVAALDTLGPAGTAARTTLAFELVGLEFLMNRMAQEVKQSAIEVSTAFANMAANSSNSMNTIASGIIIFIAAFSRVASGSQSMASTVSGSFSNMANNTRSSMNTMASGIQILMAAFTRLGSDATRMSSTVGSAFTSMGSRITSAVNTARTATTNLTSAITTMASQGASRASSLASSFASAMSRVSSSANSAASSVRSLQSAINSLKSKSITITTTYVTRYRTVYGARGAATVTTSPTNINGMHVSEFGQAELITATPLENPSGQTITGPGMQISTSGGGGKAWARSGENEIMSPNWTPGSGSPTTIPTQGKLTDEEIQRKAREFIDAVFKAIEAKMPKEKGKTIMVKETPIVLKMDAKTIIDMVNKRIFEISDSIIA